MFKKLLSIFHSDKILEAPTNQELIEKETTNEISKNDNFSIVGEVERYRDWDNIIWLPPIGDYYRKQLDATDQIVDVIFEEKSHFNVKSECFETYNDTYLYLLVKDSYGNIKKCTLVKYVLKDKEPFLIDKINGVQPTHNELDDFYYEKEYENNEDYFNHLSIYSTLTEEQFMQMLDIMIKNRKNIGLNYCDEGAVLKYILKTSKIDQSKNTRPIMLMNRFLLKDYDAPTLSNLYDDTLYDMESPWHQKDKNTNVESNNNDKDIINFPVLDRDDDISDENSTNENLGEIISFTNFRK